MELSIIKNLLDNSWEAVSGIVSIVLAWLIFKVKNITIRQETLQENFKELEINLVRDYVSQDKFDKAIEKLELLYKEIKTEHNVKLDKILDKLENKKDKD